MPHRTFDMERWMRPTTRDTVATLQSKHVVRTIACAALLGALATAGIASAQAGDTMTA
jgi:hypothetical protein